MSNYEDYYTSRRYSFYPEGYHAIKPEGHWAYEAVNRFVEQYQLRQKRCLEIGSSAGFFQDLVDDYFGTDVSEDLAKYYHKPYRVASGSRYPFPSEMFDAIWTVEVYEHIPNLQEAMLELRRMLKPGGVVFFSPAWQCRSWAAGGYAVRPYKDLSLLEKLIKLSIPLRDSVVWRSMFIFPKRLVRHLLFLCGYRYREIKHQRLEANYKERWVSDSDACNSIDPHDALLWFISNGFECLSHPSHLSAFFVRGRGLVFKKRA